MLADQLGDHRVGDLAGALGVDVDADRLGDADGVGELDLAALGQAGGDDVLGDVPGHVGGRAVDLGGVLAAEGAAAVPAHAAVGVDDDLAAGHARVAVRAADRRSCPVGLMWNMIESSISSRGRTGSITCSRDRLDDLGVRDARGVLGRDHDGVDPDRRDAVVLDVTWLLASGRSQGIVPSCRKLGDPVDDPVRQRDRQRHQLGRLVAGEAEHHALVAGADVLALARCPR